MANVPMVWFFDPHFNLQFYYDERCDQFVYENSGVTRRPANISKDDLFAARNAILSGNVNVPRTVPYNSSAYAPGYHGTSTSFAHNLAAGTPLQPSADVERQATGGSQGFALQPREPHSAPQTLRYQQPASSGELATFMSETSLGSPRRLDSYHPPVVRKPQTPQVNSTHAYTTSGSMLRSPPSSHVSALDAEVALYKTFKKKVKTKKFFVVGKVFLTLWHESAGELASSNQTAVTSNGSGISVGPYQELIHSKIRRFVVVREGERSCEAIPILTYKHKGVGKAGVKKSEHAIIYTGKDAPPAHRSEHARRGEDGLLTSIRVDPDDPAEKLDPWSRVDFAKVYCIEHNVKVRSLGKVNDSSMATLQYQFQAVWEDNFKGSRSRSFSKTLSGVHAEATIAMDSAQHALLTRAYHTLHDNGFKVEEIKLVLRAGFRFPDAAGPSNITDNSNEGDLQNDDHVSEGAEDDDDADIDK